MEVKELMVGDWIGVGKCISNMGGDYDVVYNNEQLTLEHFKFWADNNWDANDFNEFLEPIPLTPEILEKNGFSTNYCEEDLSYNESCGEIIGIHICGKGGLMDEMYFEYVHQLQHVLRLCGIEKEIVI